MRHFGAKTISSRSHFGNDSSAHISGSGSLIRINLTFVLFKHVALMWIKWWIKLETWPHSDNTSCYYTWMANENGLYQSLTEMDEISNSYLSEISLNIIKSYQKCEHDNIVCSHSCAVNVVCSCLFIALQIFFDLIKNYHSILFMFVFNKNEWDILSSTPPFW